MEEGPEPQELIEQTEQRHHESEHEETHEEAGHASFITRCAITASALAVMAALASLLSGHSANEAILNQSRATDQWAYYQAKSTKSHILEGNKFVIETLASANNTPKERLTEPLSQIGKLTKLYQSEQEKIRQQAESLESLSELEFQKHQDFSYAVACFQIGIVLASVSIMVKNNRLYMGSILCGVVGVILAVMGQLK